MFVCFFSPCDLGRGKRRVIPTDSDGGATFLASVEDGTPGDDLEIFLFFEANHLDSGLEKKDTQHKLKWNCTGRSFWDIFGERVKSFIYKS